MAFDGITVAALREELNRVLSDARISKIAQPEAEEILFTIKGKDLGQIRLLISASATLPLVYLTDDNKPSPQSAPAFCMLLRKYLTNARILSVTQPGLERVLHFNFEHRDELGDLVPRTLIVEIMGKHSNIIFVKEDGTILDSIKHVSSAISSVREVLPGRTYFLPETVEKIDPLKVFNTEKTSETHIVFDEQQFADMIREKNMPVFKAIYMSFVGISPIFAQEICACAEVDSDLFTNVLSDTDVSRLYRVFEEKIQAISKNEFAPEIIYENGIPVEYSAVPLTIYSDSEKKKIDSVSSVLREYYAQRNEILNMRQKSSDLRRVVTTALERNVKKYDLQIRQMKDTEKRDKYKIWGELLNTYGYSAEPGAKSIEVLNYYTNENEVIPLDDTLTAIQNAQKYFDKYNKLKRTYEALSTLTEEVSMEIEHLESVLNALDIARSEDDLLQIREELVESEVIHRKGTNKKVKIHSKPFHYVTNDDFHIYVGKNNLQNDSLTFSFANGSDWWFHAKKIPGSHVVLKTEGREVPDRVFELAAAAAAYYCKGSDQTKVEVDYVRRREVKKPAGAKPGYVIYYTNYSMAIAPGLEGLTLVE